MNVYIYYSVCMCGWVFTGVCVCVCVCVCVHERVCACMCDVCVCACMCVCVLTSTNMHIPTHAGEVEPHSCGLYIVAGALLLVSVIPGIAILACILHHKRKKVSIIIINILYGT